MVPPTPVAGAHSIPSSLLRSNSGLAGGQGGSVSPQSGFPSLVSQRNATNMLGNVPNVSSFLHQSYGNGGPSSGSSQRDVLDAGDESDPLSVLRNGISCNGPSNPIASGHMSGQQSGQQVNSQNFQQSQQPLQHISVPLNNRHHDQQQQQFQNIQGGLGGVGQVKMESQMTNYQHGQTTQQLQALRNLGPVKMEMQHTQSMSNLPPVKLEPQLSDQSLFLQQQQKQQFLNVSRQSSQAAAAAQINLLHQQRLLQLHQQQQLLKNIPQQRSPMQPQFQQQNLALRSPAKPLYEPGMCARRLTHYMYQQQHRPEDNSIEFWRKFVAEYFALNAKKKWCVSLYGSGRHTTGVFLQDIWQCEICNKKPGRGFEANVEVLPRLFKIKYESGTLEELLYVDMPREYQNSSGQIVLDYSKAIQESVFEQLRVVREGQLRIVFTPDLKIYSWEFCARHHEELIPRRLLIPQINQLGNAAQKYQVSTNNASSNQSAPELQNNCNMFVASARQLAKALEVPLVNDLGYTKRYVRCLQISEVVNSMKDLIDYSRETSMGPMECLAKFPRRTTTTSGFHSQSQQTDEQQQSQPQQNSNGMSTVNNSNPVVPTTRSTNGTIAGLLLHQNSINSRHQQNSNNAPQASQNGLLDPNMNSVSSPNISTQHPTFSSDADPSNSQSSVDKILHEMMMMSSSSQLDMKNMNNLGLMGNGQSGIVVNGIRGHNSLSMNARASMSQHHNHHHQQQQQQLQDMGNQLINGVGAVNGLPFDWKTSP